MPRLVGTQHGQRATGGRQDAGLVHVNNSQQFTPWSLIPSTCWYLGSGNPPPMIPEPGSLHYHSPFV